MNTSLSRDDMQRLAQAVYERYRHAYDGDVQGCCPLIADEILKRAPEGSVAVAGSLAWACGSRSHWWAALADGTILDPMGDALLAYEIGGSHREAYREPRVPEWALARCEQWRVAL